MYLSISQFITSIPFLLRNYPISYSSLNTSRHHGLPDEYKDLVTKFRGRPLPSGLVQVLSLLDTRQLEIRFDLQFLEIRSPELLMMLKDLLARV